MAVSLKHSFTSPKSDGIDSTVVQPSNWNAEHTLTAAAGKILGAPTGSTTVQELPLAFDSTGQSMVIPSGITGDRPGTPSAGMMRYNTTTKKVEVYTNSAWTNLAVNATVATSAPSSPQTGDFWFDTTNTLIKTYNGSAWVAANATPNDGTVTNTKLDASAVSGQNEKTTPVNADMVLLFDSVTSVLKKLSWENIKAGILAAAATTANYLANTNGLLSVNSVWSANTDTALTYSATITPDLNYAFNFNVTLTGTANLAVPSNAKTGASGYIRIKQGGTGSYTLSFNSAWDFANGVTPSLSTAVNAEDILFYQVLSSSRIYASLVKAVA